MMVHLVSSLLHPSYHRRLVLQSHRMIGGTSGGYDSELEDDVIEATFSSVNVWVTIGLTLVLTNLYAVHIHPNYLCIQDVHLV